MRILKLFLIFLITMILTIAALTFVFADTSIEVTDKQSSVTYRLYLPDGQVLDSPTGNWTIPGDWPIAGQDISLTAVNKIGDVEYESEKLTAHIDLAQKPDAPKDIRVSVTVNVRLQ